MLRTFKLFALIYLVICFSSLFAFGQKKNVYSIKPKDSHSLRQTVDFKVLAQGNYSKVDKPFVFVVRDEATYTQLQNLVEGLPTASTIDFEKYAVVAGFAGEKPTGGWTVEIRKNVTKILVEINSPRKDMIVTEVITSPFKVFLIPINEKVGLPLEISESFTKNLREFNVLKSEFSYSGGFAGIRKSFPVNGKLKIMSFEEYLTIFFDLNEAAKVNKRTLSDVASGNIKENALKIAKLNTGTFIESPHPPFTVFGVLKEKTLKLNFQSLPTNVADGYTGAGNLEAKSVQ
jgi:hypothetical protein